MPLKKISQKSYIPQLRGLALFLTLLVSACASGAKDPVKADGATKKSAEAPMPGTALTAAGDNSQGRFSPDGKKLLYVSKSRSSHSHAQIYELDLESKKERRVTFHDGNDSDPTYTADGARIVFSSETDEIKEEKVAISRLKKAYASDKKTSSKKAEETPGAAEPPLGEVYTQTLDGREIVRLTQSSGFDGEPDVDSKGKRVVFTSNRGGPSQIHSTTLNGKSVRLLIPSKGSSDHYPRFSPDAKSLVWSRQSKDLKSAQLMIAGPEGQSPKALTDNKSLDLQPTWLPNGEGIVFASKRGGTKFNLYSIDRTGSCLKRLTNVEFDQFHPIVSPDGKRLSYTSSHNGQNQIFAIDMPSASECLR